MTSTTTDVPNGCKTLEPAGPRRPDGYDERVAALTEQYRRTVDHIMTTRFGHEWATRGDLPDEAYVAETTFHRWLDELLDHIDKAATSSAATSR
ncbi:hypothetical protein acdb102_23090 [Acidothermaceae bacterium B102]|nr:hypothetical protein acdb102_23090 [Acidothermaceae bacterium B102]